MDKKKLLLILTIMIMLFAVPMTFANDSLDNVTVESGNDDILSDDYGRIEVENEEIEINEGETATITGTVYWYDNMECYDELNIEYSYVDSNGDLITDVTHYDPSYYGLSIDIKDLKENNSPYYVTLKPVEDDLYDDFLIYSDGINPVTITITVINPNALIDATLPEYDSLTPVGELYVSQDSGDNDNNGSVQSPFKTIQKALDYNKELGGNYEIIVENGEYDFDDSYTISNNVRITGKGKVTIRGYTGTHILFTAGANTIELNNLTITGGRAAAISGSTTINGLGESVNEGVLNIINCTFEENEGLVGAVITYSKTTILNTVFKNNQATGYSKEWQGIVSARDQSLTMNYCTFLDNTVRSNSPLIYSDVKTNVNFNFWGDNNGPKAVMSILK